MIGILKRLSLKSKPFFLLDTHAGDGMYDIDSHSKRDATPVRHLLALQSRSELTQLYLSIIESSLKKGIYPGSSLQMQYFAQQFCEQKVSIHANELAPNSFAKLSQTMHPRTHLHQKDAFEIIRQLIPPMPRRGLVLIDPPYEDTYEYQQVVQAVKQATKNWPQGIFAIWYPLLSKNRQNAECSVVKSNPKAGLSEQMCQMLESTITLPMLNIQCQPHNPHNDQGMYGSGILVINPPWELDTLIKDSFRDLNTTLFESQQASCKLDWLRRRD